MTHGEIVARLEGVGILLLRHAHDPGTDIVFLIDAATDQLQGARKLLKPPTTEGDAA